VIALQGCQRKHLTDKTGADAHKGSIGIALELAGELGRYLVDDLLMRIHCGFLLAFDGSAADRLCFFNGRFQHLGSFGTVLADFGDRSPNGYRFLRDHLLDDFGCVEQFKGFIDVTFGYAYFGCDIRRGPAVADQPLEGVSGLFVSP
jgi:hypothetical protein